MPNYNKPLSNLVARNSVVVLTKLVKSLLISAPFFLNAAEYAHSQVQRSIINLSFEEPVLSEENCWAIRLSENGILENGHSPALLVQNVTGWRTTEVGSGTRGGCGYVVPSLPEKTAIQIFRNFRHTAAEGEQWAELNAFTPARLYQTVCLLKNDKVDWTLYHRGRGATESFKFNISPVPEASTNPNTQIIVEGTSTANGVGNATQCLEGECPVETVNEWAKYQGSFIWREEDGEQTIGLEVAREICTARISGISA